MTPKQRGHWTRAGVRHEKPRWYWTWDAEFQWLQAETLCAGFRLGRHDQRWSLPIPEPPKPRERKRGKVGKR